MDHAGRRERPFAPVESTYRNCDAALRPHSHRRRPSAQPQGHRPRAAARRADRDHRALGLGQVEPCLRHDLRGGAAPLRRVAVRLRTPVPGPDGEARRGLDRGAQPGDLDRPEDDLAQPTLHGWDGDRDLRLPAPPVGEDRKAPLLQLRRPDLGPVAGADHRPRAHPGRGNAVHGHGAGGPGAQGRVRAAARRDAGPGLCEGASRRGAAPPRRADRAGQEVQARDLDRGRSPGDEGGRAKAALGIGRGCLPARRRPGRIGLEIVRTTGSPDGERVRRRTRGASCSSPSASPA